MPQISQSNQQGNSKISLRTKNTVGIAFVIVGTIGTIYQHFIAGAAFGGLIGMGVYIWAKKMEEKGDEQKIDDYFGNEEDKEMDLKEAMNVFEMGENELNRKTLLVVYRSKKSYYSKFSNQPFYQKKLAILEKAYVLLSQKLQQWQNV